MSNISLLSVIIMSFMLPRYQHSPSKHIWAKNIATQIITECVSEEPHVDPLLAVLVIGRESGYRQDVRGKAGEVGLFQIMPRGPVAQGNSVKQMLDPTTNIRLGIDSLRNGMIKCGRTPWKIAEFHHFGRCISEPSRYGRWIQRRWEKWNE